MLLVKECVLNCFDYICINEELNLLRFFEEFTHFLGPFKKTVNRKGTHLPKATAADADRLS